MDGMIPNLGTLLADYLEGAYPDRYIKVGWGESATTRNNHLGPPPSKPTPPQVSGASCFGLVDWNGSGEGIHLSRSGATITRVGHWKDDKFFTIDQKHYNAADPEFFDKVKMAIDSSLKDAKKIDALWVDEGKYYTHRTVASGLIGIYDLDSKFNPLPGQAYQTFQGVTGVTGSIRSS